MAKRAIYFDTETTGLDVERELIIEIAAYDPEEDRTFASFVNPGKPIPEESVKICGITDEMVASAPTFAEVGRQFLDFCQGDVILVAHNGARFDQPLLENECKRHDLPLPACPFIDTLHWARKFRPDLPRHSLQYLREVYDIPANQAHRALDDVIILHTLFSRMIGNLTIEQVFHLLSQKQQLSSMPFGKYRGQPLGKVPKDYFTWLASSGALDKKENEQLRALLVENKLVSI